MIKMKKDLTKLAILGLLASSCLFANAPSSSKEIAMSKCSKDTPAKSSCSDQSDSSSTDKSSCNNKSGCDGNTGCSDCDKDSSEEAEASLLMKAKRKAVSQKVIEAD